MEGTAAAWRTTEEKQIRLKVDNINFTVKHAKQVIQKTFSTHRLLAYEASL